MPQQDPPHCVPISVLSSYAQVVEAALADAGVSKDDVDWLVLHQANQRILDSAATRLGVPSDRVISNLAEYGNTSAASIPLALDEAVRANTIVPGNVVRPGPTFTPVFSRVQGHGTSSIAERSPARIHRRSRQCFCASFPMGY